LNDDPKTPGFFLAGHNINGYYAFHLFVNVAFWLPIYALFFLHQGLSYSAVLLLYAVDNLLQMAVEIPSGVLADRWGRKPVLLLGALMQAAGFFLIAFGDNIGWYVFAMALHGTALAFVSGSDAAFLYDSLLAAGREREFRSIEGRAYMFNLIGWGAGGLLGGLLAAKSLALPYILSGLTSVLAFFVMAICAEPPRMGAYDGAALSLLKDALNAVRRNGLIRSIIIYSSVIFGLLLVMHKFSQPYLERAGIGLEYFGVIYFVWLMVAAVSSNYSERVGNALGLRIYFFLLPIITGGVIIYLGLMQNVFGVALAVLYQFVWGSLRPQMYQIINHEAETSARATLLSMSGFGMSIIYIVVAPIIGWIADRYDFPPALLILGAAVVIIGIPVAMALAKRLRATE
jgi:MFS family permease